MNTIMPPQCALVLEWLESVAAKANLYSDSREIASHGEGEAVFMAYPGDESDGRNYIAQAIAAGAKAVVHEAHGFTWNNAWTVPHLAVNDLKNLAGHIAAAHYQHPDAGMFTVAVTGTNGKTSCAQWLGAALSREGELAAIIGTLGIGVCRDGLCEAHTPTGYTTPDAVMLQRNLARLRDEGVKSLAIEASSIGLDQGRLNGMHFDVALFTNFSRDHLDYHSDMASYEAAKRTLFDWPGLRYAVINLDNEIGRALVQDYQRRLSVIGYTKDHVSEHGIPILAANHIRNRALGTEFSVEYSHGKARVSTQLVGRFNVSNVLGVLGVLLAKGVKWEEAIAGISGLQPVPGRMQQLGGKDSPMVVIDYAHTPDALAKAIDALRPLADERDGKLWCVFGCGGDRDPGKRAQMGKIAEAADHVILTSDNPRSEDPMHIIAQIISGMTGETQTVEDRAAAILSAVKQADKNDVILLAGKGHETYQEVKGNRYPFADIDHASLALAARATMKKGGG